MSQIKVPHVYILTFVLEILVGTSGCVCVCVCGGGRGVVCVCV